jgi:hypothetical protein
MCTYVLCGNGSDMAVFHIRFEFSCFRVQVFNCSQGIVTWVFPTDGFFFDKGTDI